MHYRFFTELCPDPHPVRAKICTANAQTSPLGYHPPVHRFSTACPLTCQPVVRVLAMSAPVSTIREPLQGRVKAQASVSGQGRAEHFGLVVGKGA